MNKQYILMHRRIFLTWAIRNAILNWNYAEAVRLDALITEMQVTGEL